METDAWLAVAPFLAVLRQQIEIEESAHEGQLQRICETVDFTLPMQSTADEQRRARIALDLLHTLWVLDRDAWRQAMVEVVGVKMPASLILPTVEENTSPLTVVVSVKCDKSSGQVNRQRWTTLLHPFIQLTEEEVTAKRNLIHAYGQRTVRSVVIPAIPLRLFLRMTSNMVAASVDMVEAVCDHVGGISTDATSPGSCAPFALESLDLDLCSCEVTNRIARHMMRLRALGIRFHCLKLSILASSMYNTVALREDTTDRDRLLTVLLGSPPVEGSTRRVPSHVSMETLVIATMDLVQFRAAACTALESTRLVQKLELHDICMTDGTTERTCKWEWLTRAVLAPSSRTSIKHVSIYQPEIELNDIDTVARTLKAIEQEGVRGTHWPQMLAIETRVSVEEVTRLLQLIGQNLEAFTIYVWLVSLHADSVIRIQRSCPYLRFLDMSNVKIDSMDVFLDAYEQRDCQIRSLALRQVQVPNESITVFALALSDSRRRASRVLRELCVDCVGEDTELDQANLDAFYTLLDAPDCRLTYLELCVNEPLLSQNRSRFAIHHDTWGIGVASLLPMACKTAFISVCQPRLRGVSEGGHPIDGPSTQSAILNCMGELDAHTLSCIFQFAATRSRRNVCLSEP